MAIEEFNKALDASREIESPSPAGGPAARSRSPCGLCGRAGSCFWCRSGTGLDWYKNVLKIPTVRLAAGGAQLTARANPITDAAKVSAILDMFRARYGAQDVEAYYPKQDVAVEVPLA